MGLPSVLGSRENTRGADTSSTLESGEALLAPAVVRGVACSAVARARGWRWRRQQQRWQRRGRRRWRGGEGGEEDARRMPNASQRFSCYKKALYLLYGIGERDERHPLPRCVVCAIRQAWPSEMGRYTGFKAN